MDNKTAKSTITPSERLQLIGLAALANSYQAKIHQLVKVGLEITGELDHMGQPDDSGHTSDLMYGGYLNDPESQVDTALRNMEITVAIPAPAEVLDTNHIA